MRSFILFCCVVCVAWCEQIKYEKSENIVTDHTNKVIWQDNKEVKNYLETFITAQVYCETLILNGYIDWRVPTIKELQKIVDVTQTKSIESSFRYLKADIYTTHTTFVADKTKFVGIDFKSGKTQVYPKKEKYFIRCIRDI